MANLTFGNASSYDMYGNLIPTGSGPVLSFGAAAPSGSVLDPFGFNNFGYSLGSAVAPPNDAALALSGPLGGSSSNPTPSVLAAQAAAASAAAANTQASGYGASGYIYSLGALAKAILAPAQANTPGTIPAAYAPGSGQPAVGGISPLVEIGIIAVVGLVLFELIKKHK